MTIEEIKALTAAKMARDASTASAVEGAEDVAVASGQEADAVEASVSDIITAEEAAAIGGSQRRDVELAERDAFVNSLAGFSDEEIAQIGELDGERKASFNNYINSLKATEKDVGEVTRILRKKLERLSLDNRESPSVNDLVAKSIDAYLHILKRASEGTAAILDGMRELWVSHWTSVSEITSGAVNSIIEGVSVAFNVIGDVVSNVFNVIAQAFDSLIGSIIATLQFLAAAASNIAGAGGGSWARTISVARCRRP